jgi:hypothetical protein
VLALATPLSRPLKILRDIWIPTQSAVVAHVTEATW